MSYTKCRKVNATHATTPRNVLFCLLGFHGCQNGEVYEEVDDSLGRKMKNF